MSIEESDFFSDHETLVSMKILSKQVDINYALMTLFLNPNLLLRCKNPSSYVDILHFLLYR